MAFTDIDDPSQFFQTVLYNGTGSTQSVANTGLSNLKPDWVWIKERDNASTNHSLFDSSRGATKELISNGNNAEATDAQLLTQFDTDGFTVGTNGGVNGSGDEYVAWQWKANGGTTSSNSDGSITSTVQADTTAGFSIVTFTGTGSTATVGHGLGVAPAVIIAKNRDSTANWVVRHHKTDNNYDFLTLNSDAAVTANDSVWTQTDPTTSVFSIGTATAINQSSQDIVAYCFAEKQGYSKFGRYVGTGSSVNSYAFGPRIHTGFKPAWVMIKSSDSTGNWIIWDSKRSPVNLADNYLQPNADSEEGTSTTQGIDFLSNGFKIRNTYQDAGTGGDEYVYFAFAQNPFVTSSNVVSPAGAISLTG